MDWSSARQIHKPHQMRLRPVHYGPAMLESARKELGCGNIETLWTHSGGFFATGWSSKCSSPSIVVTTAGLMCQNSWPSRVMMRYLGAGWLRKELTSNDRVTISGILGIPLVNLTGCEIHFVFWLLRASGRVEPYRPFLSCR
jgi:hypothetical protein